jgi:hypothetical protein
MESSEVRRGIVGGGRVQKQADASQGGVRIASLVESGLVFGDRLDDGLGADEDAGIAEEVEAFDVDSAAVKLRDDDGEVLGLAHLVFLVGDEAALIFGEAKEFGHGVFEEGFGDMFLVEGEVVLEVVAEGLFVLLVALAGEAFDEAAIGEGFGGEAGEFRDGFPGGGDGDEVSAGGDKPHGDVEAAKDATAPGIDGEQLRMQTAVVDEDR